MFTECVQYQDKEHSQGERSEDRTPIHLLSIKEFGKTCPPMNSVMDTSGKPKSRNLLVNWYDMSIREKERQMVQIIGNSKVQRSVSNSEVTEEASSLTETGSTSSGKEATKQDSSIVRILATSYCTFD